MSRQSNRPSQAIKGSSGRSAFEVSGVWLEPSQLHQVPVGLMLWRKQCHHGLSHDRGYLWQWSPYSKIWFPVGSTGGAGGTSVMNWPSGMPRPSWQSSGKPSAGPGGLGPSPLWLPGADEHQAGIGCGDCHLLEDAGWWGGKVGRDSGQDKEPNLRTEFHKIVWSLVDAVAWTWENLNKSLMIWTTLHSPFRLKDTDFAYLLKQNT